ncbi:MAG: HAD-IA family hydrolase [Acholeplasmataceae bacterium]
MTKAIIFDFDGTIANTKAFAYQVYTKLTDQYGIKQLSEKEFDHLKTLTLVDKFRVHDISIFKLPKLVRQARKTISMVMHEIKPYDQMIELLQLLHKNNILLFIVSSNSKNNILVFTNQYNINFFEKIYGRAKYFKKEKTLKKVLKEYNLNQEEVLYIGDEVRDIRSCKKINLPIVSVTWGFDDKDMLEKENPNYIADDMESLKKSIFANK